VPPSRIDGREPVETVEHQYDGERLVRSVITREPLYTEQDRAELLALALYRDGLCPVCGGQLSECTSHEATGPKFKASAVRCRRRDVLSMAQTAKQDTDRAEALVWSVATIRR
jgi:hypothetical protein